MPPPPLDEGIVPGQLGHIVDHEYIAQALNDLMAAGEIRTFSGSGATADAQAWIDEVPATGGTRVFGESTYDDTDTGLVFPPYVRCVHLGRQHFPSTFLAAEAVTIEGHDDGFNEFQASDHVIDIERAAAGWDDGADTTSVGLRVHNGNGGLRVFAKHIMNFHHGYELQGDGASGPGGSQSVTTFLGRVINNKINIYGPNTNVGGPGPGHSNGHLFIGGQIGHTGGYSSYTGTKGVYAPSMGSYGWTFLGVDMEGGLCARQVDINTPGFTFSQCWWEASLGVWLGADADGTSFIGGDSLGILPINDSTGGRFSMYYDGVAFPGVGAAGDGLSIGGLAGQNRLQWDTASDRFVVIEAAGSIAGFRSANIRDIPGTGVAFNGTEAIAKPTVTGSRGGNAALASLLTALASQGLVTDSSSA